MWIEVYSGTFFLIGTGIWVIFRKAPIALFTLLLATFLIGIAGFREPNYNSDTWNYYSYVNTLAVVQGSAIFVLTKLEPIHAGLAFLLRNFEMWLLAESGIQIAGLYLAFRIRPNDGSFIALCAFVMTLSSSALRFSAALIFFFWFVCRAGLSAIRAAQSTIALGALHISMLMSGLIMQRRPTVLLALTFACVLVFFEQRLLGSRAEIDLTDASRGVKTVGIAMSTLIWVAIRRQSTQNKLLPYYALLFLSFFLIASMVLPMFNRFLIMGTLVLLLQDWPKANGTSAPSDHIIERIYTLLLSSAIILPYTINLPKLFFSGLW